jgi:hypothetical protein
MVCKGPETGEVEVTCVLPLNALLHEFGAWCLLFYLSLILKRSFIIYVCDTPGWHFSVVILPCRFAEI